MKNADEIYQASREDLIIEAIAENPEQKEMQQRIEQHFRTKAEHFGLKTTYPFDLSEMHNKFYLTNYIL